jgi:hypothetical protein
MQVVLVHIGNSLPTYLLNCIQQLRHFVSVPVHVLLERQHINTFNTMIANLPNIYCVGLEDIPKTSIHYEFMNRSSLSHGFWRSASERFFYLYEYCLLKNLTNIVHIENDNLIYYDFTKFLDIFSTKPLWAVFDAEHRCIPSFVYIRNADSIKELAEFFLTNNTANDMETLAMFRQCNPEFIGCLPIITNYIDPLPSRYCEHAQTFGVLFDGAAVGQYIGGIDKIHNNGNTEGFINETTIFKCDKAKVEWRQLNSLNIPYLNDLPLVNLHIHSKELERWMSK